MAFMSPDIQRRCRWLLIAAGGLSLFVVWNYLRVDDARHGAERRARASIQEQIAKVASGQADMLRVTGGDGKVAFEITLAELLQSIDRLKSVGNFGLMIGWDDNINIDRVLKIVQGLPGIRVLIARHCLLTDASIDYLIAMPNLEELSLYRVSITDSQLSRLAACPKLRSLELRLPRDFTAAQVDQVTIPAILALPHLENLKLHEHHSPKWIGGAFEQLGNAARLRTLTLVTGYNKPFPEESISSLKTKLPHCDVQTALFPEDVGGSGSSH